VSDFNKRLMDAYDEALPIADEIEDTLHARINGRAALGIIVLTIIRGRLIAQVRSKLTGSDREAFDLFLLQVDEDAAMGQEVAEAAGYDPTKLSGGGEA
jgi:hypothetical protein